MYRQQENKDDKLPTCADEIINMSDKYRNLDSGERFLLSAEKLTGDEDVALVFMSSFGKRVLETSSVWSTDGTFKTVPDQFAQLYVVHGNSKANKSLPCAYFLLPDKKASTYERTMDIVLNEVTQAPSVINIDFEQAVIKSIKSKMPPAVTILGCNFHWKKNIFSHVGFKGCLPFFYEDEQFQIGLDLIFTLCMVPPTDVVFAWESVVKPHFDEHFDESLEVDEFLDYFERTYIGKPGARGRKNPMFPISMWNIVERTLSDQASTNNAVESWNARWNR